MALGVEQADGEGVVEVLGVAGIDGAGEHLAEVLALVKVFLRYLAGYLLGGFLHGLGVFIGQSVLGEDGVHLDVVVARLSQDVDDFADGALAFLVGPLRYAHDGLVVCLAAFYLSAGYDDVVGQHVGLGYEVGHVLVYLQAAHEGVFLAFEYLDDLRFLDVVDAAGHEREFHFVAGEGAHGVALRHEDGLLAIHGYDGVLAVGLALEGAFLYLAVGVEEIGRASCRERV